MLWHFSAGVTSSPNYLANNLHKTKIIISLIELFQGEFFWRPGFEVVRPIFFTGFSSTFPPPPSLRGWGEGGGRGVVLEYIAASEWSKKVNGKGQGMEKEEEGRKER
jgi:hypothetical protein